MSHSLPPASLARLCHDAGAVATAVLHPSPDLPERIRRTYDRWGGRDAGVLDYIDSKLERLCNPFGSRPWAQSALVIAFFPGGGSSLPLPPPRPGRPTGYVAAYAVAEDYHPAGKRILEKIAQELGCQQCEISVDASPVPETELAYAAGLGSPAPNSMLYIPGVGCSANLGVLFTDLSLPDLPQASAECSHCGQCLRSCPCQALTAEGIDVRRCRSYLTTQKRGPLSLAEQNALQGAIFGCSCCSRTCPPSPPPLHHQGTVYCPGDQGVDCLDLLAMPTREIQRAIAESALAHTGATVLKRNASAIALSQTPEPEREVLRRKILALCASPAIQATLNAM